MKLFRSFRLDTGNQCLWRGEHRVPLTPKAFDVLRYLVEHPGRLVTQDELLEALWPETYVNPELIKKYILGIRKVLGDQHGNPVYIETLPKRGYQFIAPVTDHVTEDPQDLSSDLTSKIVGRSVPLSELQAAFKKALRSQRQIIFVVGESGIGKTTLVDAFHGHASRQGNVRTARGQCIEGFGGKEPYYPMLDALGQLTRSPDSARLIQTLAQRAPTWLIQFPSLIKPEQREALQREILGATRERMVREICEALESLSSETPVVLVLEDLHWVDASTLDLVSALARRREAAKLMLVCTYRPVDVILSNSSLKGLKQDLQVHNLCAEIALERLPEPAIAEYLATEFANASLPPGMANFIYRHSEGNPLFMVAMVQDMMKKGFIVNYNGEWRLTTPLETMQPGVPQSLQQMVEVQFERLKTQEQRVLEAGSVVGEHFSAWVIAGALEEELDRLEDLCDDLAARQQVIKALGIQELPNGLVSAHYEFRHSLYRQAVYRRLSSGKQVRLHRAIAARLETLSGAPRRQMASEIAFHFESGREYEQGARFLLLAAENAAGRFAYRDCIHVLQHALELTTKIEGRVGAELEAQILEFIGDSHYALGAMAESAAAYETAASRAGQAGLKAAQVSALSAMVRPFGFIDPDRGIAAVNRAVEVSRSIQNPTLFASTQMLAAASRLLYDCWTEEDAALCESEYKQLDEKDIPPFHKLFYAQIQALQGNSIEALEMFEKGLSTLNQTTSVMEHIFAISGKTVTLLRMGRLGDVLQIVRHGREMAEKNGNDPWLFNFREAWLRMVALDFEGSSRVCDDILRMKTPYPVGQPQTISRIARGYSAIAKAYSELDHGQYGRAIEFFNEVRDSQTTPKFFLHWVWRLTAQLGIADAWLQSGDIEKASAEADGFLHSALQTAHPHLQALAWEMQTRVAITKEDWRRADDCIHKGLEIIGRFEVPVAGWQVHATAWRLFQSRQQYAEAESHRQRAQADIFKIADSFPKGEPLRDVFLSAMPIARILNPLAEKGRAADG
jgi:DNA-binding winged helix-turn-helix (wHTH) protein/tetratricopeptide (TPR) repeat protein